MKVAILLPLEDKLSMARITWRISSVVTLDDWHMANNVGNILYMREPLTSLFNIIWQFSSNQSTG